MDLLRGHWLTGRLTAEEFEERVGEAWRARFAQDLWHALRWLPVESAPVPARAAGSGTAAVLLGIAACCVLVFTLGLGFPIALPLFVAAWAAGREARRSPGSDGRGTAVAGEVLGIAGTGLCLLFLASCAAVLA